jgi:dihydrolipoamide dehydrogenase
MERKVAVAIIGAGTAGINAMSVVRETTDDFVLINGGMLGTTCARVGCVPSKVMIQIADDFHRRHILATEGIVNGGMLAIDLGAALTRVRAPQDQVVGSIIEDMIEPLGDRFIEGYAEFIEPTLILFGLYFIHLLPVFAINEQPRHENVFPSSGRHLLPPF